jgi:hypothetical protein
MEGSLVDRRQSSSRSKEDLIEEIEELIDSIDEEIEDARERERTEKLKYP